tara:strand:+ start:843124 stop:845754 length:2631 start_codon:yes stop_codon:yes gene_type:complete
MRFNYNKSHRLKPKIRLALLAATTLAVFASPAAYAQSEGNTAQIYNPTSPWQVTDGAMAPNPSCMMQRNYASNIHVVIKSDITGKAQLLIDNIPEYHGSTLAQISFGAQILPKGGHFSNNQILAPIGLANAELAALYQAETIDVTFSNASAIKLPAQSTAIAEAQMGLCVDLIAELTSMQKEPRVSAKIAAPVRAPLPPPDSVEASAPIELTPSAPEIPSAIEPLLEVTDLISETIKAEPLSEPALDAINNIAEIDNATLPEDIPSKPLNEAAKPQETRLDDVINQALEKSLDQETDVNIAQAPIKIDEQASPVKNAPTLDDALEEALNTEALISDAPAQSATISDNGATSLTQEPAEVMGVEDTAMADTLQAIENFGVESALNETTAPASQIDTQTDIMSDADILSALENNIGADTETQNWVESAVSTDLPLDDLTMLGDATAPALDAANMSISDEDILALATKEEDSPSTAASTSVQSEAAMLMGEEELFADDSSIEIATEDSITTEDDQDLVDDFANEDFSDEELLALLDNPDALSDNFAEALIEEDFVQVKPMDGIRDMIGLGTPAELEYRKVPWLMEEDIDSQWKEKVKLLEREKEKLRLRLADSNSNPIAHLISSKRNKRTQEELVEKIQALEAENKKLKSGLVLSQNAEEFANGELNLKDPNTKMRLGSAQPSEVDLIDQKIDRELDSLETRMDSFLKGMGEDYALANADKVSPLSSSSLTQDIINILKAGYVVDPDALSIRAYRHKSTGTAVTAWEAGDLQGRAERSVLPPNSDFTAYVDRFLNAAQMRCKGNFTAVPDTSTRNLRSLDIHCNDGAIGQRSSVLFIRHGAIITAIATTTTLPKGDADYLRDIRKRIIEGVRAMDLKKT